jgi:hypothetical protein
VRQNEMVRGTGESPVKAPPHPSRRKVSFGDERRTTGLGLT